MPKFIKVHKPGLDFTSSTGHGKTPIWINADTISSIEPTAPDGETKCMIFLLTDSNGNALQVIESAEEVLDLIG